jgi:hypothetical protein
MKAADNVLSGQRRLRNRPAILAANVSSLTLMSRGKRGAAIVVALLTLVLLPFLTRSEAASLPPWTAELADEFLIGGDVNQDGIPDVVIVSKSAGAIQLGHQNAEGQFHFIESGPAGIKPVTGASFGNQLFPGQAGLAVTGPEANRVSLIELGAGAISPSSQVYVNPAGPHQVIALPIPGPGATALDDLFVSAIWNSPTANISARVRNSDGVNFSPLGESPLAGRLERLQKIVLEQGGPILIAGIMHSDSPAFVVMSVSAGIDNVLLHEGLPADVQFAYGFFAEAPHPHIVFYRQKAAAFSVRRVASGVGGMLVLGQESSFTAGMPIRQVLALSDETTSRLLFVFDDGLTAAVYDFDGENTPVLNQALPLPDGFKVIGAVGLGLNVFVRLAPQDGSSGDGSGLDDPGYYAYFGVEGGNYVLLDKGQLKPASLSSGDGNVFEFHFEPFIHPQPRLLRVLKAGDWTSQLNLGGGQVAVVRESYTGSETGLGNPVPAMLGPKHPQSQFGLPNQFREDMSFFTFIPPVENPVAQVSVFPPPGKYPRSVRVQLTADRPNVHIRYRLGDCPWNNYNDPFVIFAATTVSFYAQDALSPAKSAIRSARYEFDLSPGKLDSDGDGVPDFVKVALGLDPLSGELDSDGDGFSDLEEILRGWDPADPSDPVDLNNPQPGDPKPGFEQRAGFDLAVTPFPWDGASNAQAAAAAGTLVQLHELTGAFLLANATEPDADQPGHSTAWFEAAPVQAGHPFLVLSTEPHFNIVTANPDSRIGRELIRVFPQPQVKPVIVDYVYGQAGGNLAAEADAWIKAAQDAYLNAERETFAVELTVADTLAALLLARELTHVVQQRGMEPEIGVTLTPFRFADKGRLAIGDNVLALVESAFGNEPPYRMRTMFDIIDSMIQNPPNPMVSALIDVAHEIYRISSALNNEEPGAYPPPVDALRSFIEEGTLHSSYDAALSFPPGALQNAQNGLNYIRNQIAFRPFNTVDARVRFDTFTAPCRILNRVDISGEILSLFDDHGRPFSLPETFQLLPGTLLRLSGYTDFIFPGCPGQSMEVVKVELLSVPVPGAGDSDGNLLDDEWEELYGGIIGDPFADSDGDGYPDIQEMWEGTNPLDPNDFPNVPPVQFEWPFIEIGLLPGGEVELLWSWPEAYIDKIEFLVHATTDLHDNLIPVPVSIIHLGGGQIAAYIPAPESGVQAQFFTISLALAE